MLQPHSLNYVADDDDNKSSSPPYMDGIPYTLQWAAPSPSQKCPFPWGSELPSNTWFPGLTRVHNPKDISIGKAVLQAMRPIVNIPEKDRATDIANMHKRFGKDRACGSEDILSDRETHRQTHSSQYCATALAGGEVITSE